MMTKNFPRLQEAMDFATKNTSLPELGRVLLVTACSSAKARSIASVCKPSYGNTATTKGDVGDLMCPTALLKASQPVSCTCRLLGS